MNLIRKSEWLLALVFVVALLHSGPVSAATAATGGDIRRDATVVAIEQALPCVVNIATRRIVERVGDPYLEILRRFYGQRVPTEKREEPYAVGSGVIIDEEGYLLTNLHVLEHADKVLVKLWNGEVYEARERVGTSQRDVALLQIVAPPGKKFQAMKFAPDDDLSLGETVIALGNPYGLGESVTRGILSSKNRRQSSGSERLDFPDWLQTDADINPGNSGGPLINLRGEMIGINVAVYRESQGMGVGFAIPIKQVTKALSQFFTPEASGGAWFGLHIGSFYPPLKIAEVQPGSPAAAAGVNTNQSILTVNGKAPRSLVDFHRLLTADEKDLTPTLQVEANGKRRTITIRSISSEALMKQRLGLTLRDLTAPEAASLGAKPGDFAIIEQVEKNSPADKAKLKPGVLLTAADDRKAGELLHSVLLLATKQTGDPLRLAFIAPRGFGANAGNYTTILTVR